ncbi:MAG: phage head morphogenesis protein, partial [Treponema socranskii subsp. buccale]
LAWDGLILPKDDPWWNNHFPPNGYGCKCYTRAVTGARKQRYENEGIKVPPAADGSGGGTLHIKTKAPPDKYRNYFNERKGTLERLPQGITPGFNWNQGQAGRTIPVLQECLKKAQQEMPQEIDAVIKTLQNSTIYRDELSAFVDEAYKNKAANRVNTRNTTPVGFFDKKNNGFPARARNRCRCAKRHRA